MTFESVAASRPYTNATRRLSGLGEPPLRPLYGARILKPHEAPLRTAGRYIVDRRGERIKWACVSWYGAYSTTHAVGGLEVRPMEAIVDRIVELGFNCVRMMYSTQGYVHNPLINDADLAANPELRGMRFLEVFDRTVQAMTDKGLMVIINNHNSKSGWCCHYSQDEGLWYVPEYSEEQWIESLVFFAARYRENPMVVAFDLRNEVHDYEDTHLTWGGGDLKTDWAAAAVRAGNAVLAVNPDQVIVVMAMCFGMDLRLMRDLPLQMMYPNRIVYQAHNYLEFQFFDNVSKMVAPWHVIRDRALLAACVLLFLLITLLYGWVRVGKPRPRPGVVRMSVGAWWLAYFLGVAVTAWNLYNFATMFCSVAADSDILPWIHGSLIMSVVCVLTILNGGRRLYKERCGKQKVDDVDDGIAGVCPGRVEAGGSGATDEAQDAGEDAMSQEVPGERDEVPRTWPPPTDKDDAASDAAPSARKKAQCCGRCSSWWRATLALSWDVERLSRRLLRWLGLPLAIPPRRNFKPEDISAEWDVGMMLGLQLGICAFIVMLSLMVLYIFAHIVPTYWWMERHLDGLWGFALEEGYAFTAPVWMGEFGGEVRGQWWINMVRYLSTRDVDFAYWAINGKKWAEGELDGTGNFVNYDQPRWEEETFGLLNSDYDTVRHAWKILDLQALMSSPATWRPEVAPCSRSLDPSCGG